MQNALIILEIRKYFQYRLISTYTSSCHSEYNDMRQEDSYIMLPKFLGQLNHLYFTFELGV